MKVKFSFWAKYVATLDKIILWSFLISFMFVILCHLWFYNNKWIEIVNVILLSYVAGIIIYFISAHVPNIQKKEQAKPFLFFWIDSIIFVKDNFISWKYANLYLDENESSDSELFINEHIYPTIEDCMEILNIIFKETTISSLGCLDEVYNSGGINTQKYIEKLLLVREDFPELNEILFRLINCNYVRKAGIGGPLDNKTFKECSKLLLRMYVKDVYEFCCIVKELEMFKNSISLE